MRFSQNNNGSTTVEFALISMPFLFTLMLAFSAATVMFLQQQMDYATNKAAREIMTGNVQKSGLGSSDFRNIVVCSYLPKVMSCEDVIVNVQTTTVALSPAGYNSFIDLKTQSLIIPTLSNVSPQYSIGVQGSYEYLQVIYPITFLPDFMTKLLSAESYNGVPAYLLMSTAAFRNEKY